MGFQSAPFQSFYDEIKKANPGIPLDANGVPQGVQFSSTPDLMGRIVGGALPVVGGLLGGPLGAAAGGALGSQVGGQGVDPMAAIKGAAMAGGSAYLAGHMPSFGGGGSAGAGGAAPAADMGQGITDTAGGIGSSAVGTQGSSLVDKLLGGIKNNPDLLSSGVQALGAGAQAYVANKNANNQYNLQKSQLQLNQGTTANQLQRQQDMSPMRDQAMYALTQRMGMTPQNYHANDAFQPTVAAQAGGVDPEELARRQAAYQPGQGGVSGVGSNPASVSSQLLRSLGYGK